MEHMDKELKEREEATLFLRSILYEEALKLEKLLNQAENAALDLKGENGNG